MPDLQASASQAETRSEIHRQYFYKLCNIKTRVEELLCPTLDAEQLCSLSVHRLNDLDIDETSPCDFGPRYFVPLPNSSLPDLIERGEACDEDWYPGCTEYEDFGCLAFSEACYRLGWFTAAHGTSYSNTLYDKSGWVVESLRRRDKLPFFEGYLPHNNPELLADPPVFKGESAFGTKDKSLPHMIGEVVETEVAGTDILRSDILVAITLMKRQLRTLSFRDHHTIPVLILSIQHDTAARISQVHFDGERVFIRRSRQLDLRGSKPTDDAYLLLRWLSCRATGDTLYTTSACHNEEDDQVTWERPNSAIAVQA